VTTPAISEQVPMSSAAARVNKLCRMLQSTLRNYPMAKLQRGRGGFGAYLADGTWIRISYSGPLSGQDLRDLLALFATWCAVDPGRLIYDQDVTSDGVSLTAVAELNYSNGQVG
jgi:hypothetical protein